MNFKTQIKQLISYTIILLLSCIVIFGPLSVVTGTTNADQTGIMVLNDSSFLTEAQQKISSDLRGLISDPEDLSLGATAYTNTIISLDTSVNSEPGQQLVFVYIGLLQGEPTTILDPYVWNITSRDEDNSQVAAWVDVYRLEEIALLKEVRNIRTVARPLMNLGSVTTAGDAIHRTNLVRSGYGHNGNGIKVGVISNGVDAISTAQASGDLPSDVTILRNNVGGNEGIAMMEIIHDMAPGAKLYFHDHGNSIYEFNDAIDELIASGCTIIVDDITWPDEPFFEDGVVAKHVAKVIANDNIIYISAAGNSGTRHYQGMFIDDGTGFHNKIFPLPKGTSFQLFLQWDDQFGSSANDYDLYVLDRSGRTIAFSSNRQNGNGDPLEWIKTSYLTEPAYVKIRNSDGTAQQCTLELFIYPASAVTLDQTNLTSSDSIFGHPAVPDVIAVAAISANDVGHDDVEYFSSRGPVTIAYPISTIREKPDLAGINRVAVTGAGNFGTIFSGTSASAPHIAAVAAQLWGSDVTMSAAEVRTILYESAEDIGPPGFDYNSGYGRVDALNCFTSYVNHAPVLEDIGNREIDETQHLTISLLATDMDGDDLIYSTDAPFGTLTGNVFSWTPTYDDAGTYNVIFSVSDGTYTDSRTTVIKVNNVDRAPELQVIGNKWINEGSLLEFVISASDPDGDVVTYSVTGLPTDAIFDAATGTFSWIPSNGTAGNYQVTFTAEANGLSVSEVIIITVGDMGRAPDLGPIGNKFINEADLLEFVVSASDPEGGIITLSATGLPDGAIFDTETGIFSWIPGYNDSGIYNVVFTAEANNLSVSEYITITVNNVDREPILNPIGNKEVNEKELLSFTISAIDLDMDPISYLATNLPYEASLNNVTGEFNWVPSYSDSGVYNVRFVASSNGLMKSENVVITVHNVDRAPQFAAIGDKVTDENQLLSFNISATDEDGDIITYSAEALPEGAELNSETGDFSWTPTAAGSYVVTFIAESNGLNDSQTITIDVLGAVPFISDLLASDISSSSITLTWTNSPGIAFVEIYRNSTIIGNVTGSTSQYTDSGLESNTSYEYSLLPYDVGGNEGAMVNITLFTSSPSPNNGGNGVSSGGSNSGSSSGSASSRSTGGGGGASSAEDFANVVLKDVDSEYLRMNASAIYEFKREGNPIKSVSLYSLKNSGEITSTVEVLKDRSRLVTSDPEGLVYKYINIWVGKFGFSSTSNINDIRIKFVVATPWLQEQGVDPADIRLQRYDGGVWTILPTYPESVNSEYSTFESITPGFSPFVITAENVLASSVSSAADIEPVQMEDADLKESQPKRSSTWTIIVGIFIISLVAVGYVYLSKR
ncbi:putative Ig domain-containing protein [Methanomethylovorans sp.]|uniref:putative Ig domain-containing protein n=1 Tax=Methanomethylovorans sp. TaxID=2758717 RepID=UPI00345E89EA